ncbi:MAG TPA: P-II family nitrogen regulator [Lacipirellulaceae bacterium]|jgi:nitrogen regulatory protein P-II 1
MKKIEAIIRESKLESVTLDLQRNGVHGMTVSQVRGLGAQAGCTTMYRGVTRRIDFIPRLKLEIVVDDPLAERVVDAIFQAAHTGEIGDGRILVSEVESVTHIRTGETDEALEVGTRREPAIHATAPVTATNVAPACHQPV